MYCVELFLVCCIYVLLLDYLLLQNSADCPAYTHTYS